MTEYQSKYLADRNRKTSKDNDTHSSSGDKTEYRSKYSNVDGKREKKTSVVEYTRNYGAQSVNDSDDGVSSHYRSDRSKFRSRVWTSSSETKTSTNASPRNISTTTTTDLCNKYSPMNYIPLTVRLQQQQNQNSYVGIPRSNFMRPSTDSARAGRKPRYSATNISELPDPPRSWRETSPQSKMNSPPTGIKELSGNEVITVTEPNVDSNVTATQQDIYWTNPLRELLEKFIPDAQHGLAFPKRPE